MSAFPLHTAAAVGYAGLSVQAEGPAAVWELSTHASTHDSRPGDDEGISFPLSQPDPPRKQNYATSASVQRRRRSAACCSAPYVASGQQQMLHSPHSAPSGSARRRQHTPTFEARPPTPPHAGFGFKDEKPTAEESEKAARDLAEAALASASALAADAHAVDPAYTAKPTAFLYRGHTAQIATSTAGMYGEMIESFIKQVVAYAKQYGADQFSVFCDLGSGRGAPSAIAAYEHDWLACLGIEKCPQAFGLSLETQRCLLLREASDRLRQISGSGGEAAAAAAAAENKQQVSKEHLQELFQSRPARAVAFSHDDLSAFVDLEGVTHAYSFDAAMEGPLIN